MEKRYIMSEKIDVFDIEDSRQEGAVFINEVRGQIASSHVNLHRSGNPHRHNYYEILVIMEGGGQHEIDFQKYPLHSHSIHFLSPGQVHMISRQESYHAYEIIFDGNFYLLGMKDHETLLQQPFFHNNSPQPVLRLKKEEFEELLPPVRDMKNEFAKKRSITDEVIRSCLHIFFVRCQYYFNLRYSPDSSAEDPEQLILNRFRKLVEKHFSTLHSVTEYATMLNLTPVSLNNRVKKGTGICARDIIIDRIILEAKRLLLFTDLTSKEIAYRLNYDEPSYFSRIFRKKTGVTPSLFRTEMKKKYRDISNFEQHRPAGSM